MKDVNLVTTDVAAKRHFLARLACQGLLWKFLSTASAKMLLTLRKDAKLLVHFHEEIGMRRLKSGRKVANVGKELLKRSHVVRIKDKFQLSPVHVFFQEIEQRFMIFVRIELLERSVVFQIVLVLTRSLECFKVFHVSLRKLELGNVHVGQLA